MRLLLLDFYVEVQLFVNSFPKMAADTAADMAVDVAADMAADMATDMAAAIAAGLSCEKFNVGLSASNVVHNNICNKRRICANFFVNLSSDMAAIVKSSCVGPQWNPIYLCLSISPVSVSPTFCSPSCSSSSHFFFPLSLLCFHFPSVHSLIFYSHPLTVRHTFLTVCSLEITV